MRTSHLARLLALMLVTLAAVTLPAHAQVLIDQAAVEAGGITPGDDPGFPATISVAGSYRLTSNLVVPAGVNGIEITGENVTIDLNGFTIAGPSTREIGSGVFANANI